MSCEELPTITSKGPGSTTKPWVLTSQKASFSPGRVKVTVFCPAAQGDPLEATQFLAGPFHTALNLVNIELDHLIARASASVLHINAHRDLAGRWNPPGGDLQI